MDKDSKKAKDGIQLTIIEQIEALMEENNVNQAKLSRDINIGQAQLSKCLSRKGGNHFGIETLIKISEYFKVPVDRLLGRTTLGSASRPRSNAEICRNLINLIETGAVNISINDIEQDICLPTKDDNEDQSDSSRYEKKNISYKMFFFSNYTSHPDKKVLYNPKGIEINAFIEYYLKLRDLYKKNELPKVFYEQAIEDRLNQMRY